MACNIFPRSSMDQGAITALRAQSAKVVQRLASGANPVSGLTYRNLRPTDTSLNGTVVTGFLVNNAALVANTYITDVLPNFTPKQTQAFVLLGIELLTATPIVDEFTIYVGADVVAVCPVGEIKSPAAGTTPQIGYFSNPIFVPPQLHCRIDMMAGAAQTISLEKFNLIGYVGEPEGNLLTGAASQNAYWASA